MKKKRPKKKAAKKGKTRKPRKAARAKKKPAGKKAAPKREKAAVRPDIPSQFQQALELAMRGFLFDAVRAFGTVAKGDSSGEWADDALFNQGLCYLRMNLFHDAIASFTRVIQGYPEATIAATTGSGEHGRTAAKALLGRLRCHLALGDTEQARSDLSKLSEYEDSYVVDDEGKQRTFYELGNEALAVASN